MKKKAWLPINFQLAADVTAGAVILSAEDYQIINAKGAAKKALLVSRVLTLGSRQAFNIRRRAFSQLEASAASGAV